MDVRVYAIDRHKRLVPDTVDAFLADRQSRRRYFWVDVCDPDGAGATAFLAPLALHPLVVERCLDPNAASGVSPYEGVVFLQVPLRAAWDAPGRPLLSVICLPRAIVTLHRAHVRVLDGMASDFAAVIGRHEITTSAMLYLLLDRLIDETTAFVLDAGRAVEALEEAMGEGADPERIGGRILSLKRALAHLEIYIEEQHRAVAALLSLETESFSVRGLREYFHDAVAHLEHDLRHVERIEARLTDLHQHYQLLLQDRTGNRLKILTVVSAVFLPLTLLAGIYGMNFDYMPELRWHYGYPAVLALMGAIVGGLLWYLYRKGWFR